MAAFSSAFAAWALTGAIGGVMAGKAIGAKGKSKPITADAPVVATPPPIPTAKGLTGNIPRVQTPTTPRPGQIVQGGINSPTANHPAKRKPPQIGGWAGSAQTRLEERRSIANGGY
jgi:hypothetical protein